MTHLGSSYDVILISSTLSFQYAAYLLFLWVFIQFLLRSWGNFSLTIKLYVHRWTPPPATCERPWYFSSLTQNIIVSNILVNFMNTWYIENIFSAKYTTCCPVKHLLMFWSTNFDPTRLDTNILTSPFISQHATIQSLINPVCVVYWHNHSSVW